MSDTDIQAILFATSGLLLVVVALGLMFRFALAASVGSVLIMVMIAHRSLSAALLEASGPVMAEQLDALSGGSGYAIGLWASFVLVLSVVYFFLRPGAFVRVLNGQPFELPGEKARLSIADVGFWSLITFLTLLYGDLFRRGVIPLLEGMERYQYAREVAGPLHLWLFDYGNLLCFHIGVLFFSPMLRSRFIDLRFGACMAALFFYCFLTGHRFSAFYAFGSFFLIGSSAVVIARQVLNVPAVNMTKWQARLVSPASLGLLAALVVMTLVSAIGNSYFNVRFDESHTRWESLYQRIVVQPTELWMATGERVFGNTAWDSEVASYLMFQNPLDPSRNTGMQMLMYLALGDARTVELLGHGTQYTGGFPDSLFEWLGPVGGFGGVLMIAVAYSVLLRWIILSILRGHYLSMFWQIYVLYGVCIALVGGMLNVFVVWTFWVKVVAMLGSMFLEAVVWGEKRPLLPWVLMR